MVNAMSDEIEKQEKAATRRLLAATPQEMGEAALIAELKKQLESTQKQAAAMREAVEEAEECAKQAYIDWDMIAAPPEKRGEFVHKNVGAILDICKQALSSDAGREFVRREDTSQKPENIDTSPGHVAKTDVICEYCDWDSNKREQIDGESRERWWVCGHCANEQLTARTDQLRAERDELKKENERLQTLVRSHSNLCIKLEEEGSSLEVERDELKKENEALGMQLTLGKEREAGLRAGANILRSECDKLTQERDELKKSLDAVFRDWKEDRALLTQERDAARAECATLRDELDELKRENERLTKANQSMRSDLTAHPVLVSQVIEQRDAARAECAALGMALTNIIDTAEQHQFDISVLVTEPPKNALAWRLKSMAVQAGLQSPIGTAYRERVERLVKCAADVVTSQNPVPYRTDKLREVVGTFEPFASSPELLDRSRETDTREIGRIERLVKAAWSFVGETAPSSEQQDLLEKALKEFEK
jgi:DNA repair exonuclease SbcCD ATPase subunit